MIYRVLLSLFIFFVTICTLVFVNKPVDNSVGKSIVLPPKIAETQANDSKNLEVEAPVIESVFDTASSSKKTIGAPDIAPLFDVLSDPSSDEASAIIEDKAIKRKGHGQIAIVIDDLGYSKYTRDIIDMDQNVTAAFLPDAPHVTKYMQRAADKGHEIIIHMPMEAGNFAKEEKSILKVGMSKDEIYERLDAAFEKVPLAIGINNHTGSKYTSDYEALRPVMFYLRMHRKFMLDSRTIASSKVPDAAEDLGVPYLVRHVFIDHFDDDKEIDEALSNVERIARENGFVIAIGHPRQKTVKALKAWLPELESRGYSLVKLSTLLQR